jgi:hypothetical protein
MCVCGKEQIWRSDFYFELPVFVKEIDREQIYSQHS